MQRFRGGLVFKDHRLLYHSTLGSRVIKKKKVRGEHNPGKSNFLSEYFTTQNLLHKCLAITSTTQLYNNFRCSISRKIRMKPGGPTGAIPATRARCPCIPATWAGRCPWWCATLPGRWDGCRWCPCRMATGGAMSSVEAIPIGVLQASVISHWAQSAWCAMRARRDPHRAPCRPGARDLLNHLLKQLVQEMHDRPGARLPGTGFCLWFRRGTGFCLWVCRRPRDSPTPATPRVGGPALSLAIALVARRERPRPLPAPPAAGGAPSGGAPPRPPPSRQEHGFCLYRPHPGTQGGGGCSRSRPPA